MHKVLLFLVMLSSFAAFPAMAMETAAKQAIMMDADTRTVIFAKNPDEQMHPSSMTKLMTLYIAFTRLKEGRMKLTDALPVSEKAWRMQGSKTFVKVGETIPVEELLYGIAVQSGNDACIVLAEAISGSEEAFAAEMNKVAKEIGMNSSNFLNATGWPDDGHLMSARDLATLAERIIEDFPEYYHYFATPEHTYNKIRQYNRNLLLGGDLGVDGLKTGHTEIAGYGITLSGKKDGRRLVLVINGLTSEKERKEEGDRLLRYGFREFTNKKLVSKGQSIANADVWFGKKASVGLIADQDIVMTVPQAGAKDMSFTLKYNSPVPAPIVKGAHIADLVIKEGGSEQTIPLMAAEDVETLSGFGRIKAFFQHILMGSAPAS